MGERDAIKPASNASASGRDRHSLELGDRLGHRLDVFGRLVSASVREQMVYRRSFLLEVVGRMLITGLELVAVFFLFQHVNAIGGWTRWEVVYLYGTASSSLGIAELLTSGLKEMPELVRSGRFDGLLLRPVPALLQVLGRHIKLFYLGRTIQGIGALVLALVNLDVTWTTASAAFVLIGLVSGILVFAALFVGAAAQCFWTVESTEMFNAFTYGGVEMAQYPINIYRPWIRTLFLFVIPVGFVSYYPALAVLGKPDVLGFPAFFPWLAPFVAAMFAGVGYGFWRIGVRHYESTGS